MLEPFSNRLRKKYGEVMIDFPSYLMEASNKFRVQFRRLSQKHSNSPAHFFQKFRNFIDIPVISASYDNVPNYIRETKTLQMVQQDFDKCAVRVRVPTFKLRAARSFLNSYLSLLKTMNEEDTLLLDIFSLSRVEQQINSNLQLMIDEGKKRNLTIFVLNAFEPYDSKRNFGPLLTYYYDLTGFGDFATEKRYPPAGGRPPETRIVRYYYWDKYLFKAISSNDYPSAASRLKKSKYWINRVSHRSTCIACKEIEQNQYNNSPSYWKRSRILHYLSSITGETQQQFSGARSEEDLDPDGYDILFNTGAI